MTSTADTAPWNAAPPPRLAVHRSRALIPPFAFHRANSFAAAREMLDRWPDAAPVAGGLDITNRMKEGCAPSDLVWLGRIEGAGGIERHGDELVIGALVRHDQLASSRVVHDAFPELATLWGHLANIRIRCQGTVVGNVMAGMAGYEAAVLLAAANARLVGLRAGGGAFDIAVPTLADPAGSAGTGLVTAIRVPLAAPGRSLRLVYDRSLRPALSVAFCLELLEGRVAAARVAVGGTHARPLLLHLAAEGMNARDLPRAARDLAHDALDAMPACTAPYHGDVTYRARVAPVLLARLIAEAAR